MLFRSLAAVSGHTPFDIATLLGAEFHRRQAMTERMLEVALDRLGLPWTHADPARTPFPPFGLVRVQWHGPWMSDRDPYARLTHSHWVASFIPHPAPPADGRIDPRTRVFDFNAIGVGGWIDIAEWRECLVPWLLERAEPDASGPWHVSDAYHLARPA